MSTVHETIYPVLPAEPGEAELKAALHSERCGNPLRAPAIPAGSH